LKALLKEAARGRRNCGNRKTLVVSDKGFALRLSPHEFQKAETKQPDKQDELD